ncbi:MAG: AAA family ATPase [Desulfobacterales bacterium]|nr:AAA family ATPase [Desulfobacterales bacterium]
MKSEIALTQKQLSEFLLNVAIVRPVFIWGPPGIGKSSLVEQFAKTVGLTCVSLLGSQLAPEDIIGVPQIINGKSRFCPPSMIARDEAYCLFLDELNACSHEVQKSFYSLIHEQRVGDYHLPNGSIVIGAGNRAQDNAIVKPMSSALMNRLIHVQLRASHRDWLEWAHQNQIHKWIIEYIQNRPDHLWTEPPKTEQPFSTPRSWHMLSDGLHEIGDDLSEELLTILTHGCLSPHHAIQFGAFVKQIRHHYTLSSLLKGDFNWPDQPKDRDILYFLAQSFRAHLMKQLPSQKDQQGEHHKELAHKAKALIKQLARISFEIAQMVVAQDEESKGIPSWFMVEIARDLPRIVIK